MSNSILVPSRMFTLLSTTDGTGFDIPPNVNLCNLPPGILPGDLEGVPEDILRENFPEIFEARFQVMTQVLCLFESNQA